MQAALCLLFATLCVDGVSASPLKSFQVGGNLASMDEVNILMYGVLQFSESMHHIYQSTEARLTRVMKAISRTESKVKRLGHDTEEAAQTERQIKEKLQIIQAQMKALQNQVQENKGTVTRVELEGAELRKKLTSLEENLNNSVPDMTKGTTFKNISLLKDLMKWTQEQKLKLENQNQQLADLQKQNMV
ncbi:angiopoietin-like protein 8 [Pseudorasbora parva]|uniref:angiopoietin-like protein 8 n=1 Tax=Pseudorasbora parva TaxID=51549 RepID=UPI00351F17A2